MRFSGPEQKLLEKLPDRIIDDILMDIIYQLIATLNKNKSRDESSLYALYKREGGVDSIDDFKLKWSSGRIKTGNVRELREFKTS